MAGPELLTPKALVERWGGIIGLRTLERWRNGRDKVGPRFVRIGNRVAYRIEDVIEYEQKHLHITNQERVQDE